MIDRVLILGGRGRIGRSVAADLLAHTSANITITGRAASAKTPWQEQLGDQVEFLALNLSDQASLNQAVANANLVIHCAGPFRYRDDQVLRCCIDQGVNYIDVSDDRSFTRTVLKLREAAQAANVTAIVNSGVFPGISNSMVRQAVEQLDSVETIHLSYVVAGSGGAGVTVMRTTFLGLQHPFEVWLDDQWKQVKPYTGRELIDFPPPFGRTGVYWFDMPEAFTLTEAFSAQNVIVKFGSAPDFYNHLTALVANWFPAPLVRHPGFVEALSRVGHSMTAITDRFSGIGVAMQAEVSGEKDGQSARYQSILVHDSTAVAAGCGTGSLAELVLSGQVQKPGVWAVEEALPTHLFEQAMQSRGVTIQQHWL
ncbi:saccharopine dehydrogenase family protein [Thermocoleostomius sinensis]|uniref:Saccharopine dehydrogenase NADP-binding domain-containing protein n=1 Tax=Thermocoleostomius sinensis A174 TaxID=2016057 RepID=A0A9E9C554_9CYAN|nr:saccharopine dehydrogenase NADP-binding domain-containing protein [Thermocoleostomius sinensis]WAL60751.1 saccharopine dehydrogenase NADP-binding domain-containing protein [Thermocoleostomius sinensis A174]